MSTRRSSRALSSQTGLHTNSTQQGSTMKGERNTRSGGNSGNGTVHSGSERRASTVRSESLDDTESRGTDLLRRSRRGNESEGGKEKDLKLADVNPEDDAEEVLEDDVTRCICGRTDYPGPGASVQEQLAPGVSLSEDTGNFFVQCDECHVWQHGGCMGLINETTAPDEYYCEKCRPQSHKIIKANGVKSSRYLPLQERPSNRSSPLSSIETTKKSNGKSKTLESTKRRATMNSRGAYDEDEMLRRAIEESKEMGTLGKRTREDSEDQRPGVKRQRTGSSEGSELGESHSPHLDEARMAANDSKNSNKLRGAAAKNNREKELRDRQKEVQAAQRAEAASKRHARSERRRGEDSPPPSPALSPPKTGPGMATAPETKGDTPPISKSSGSASKVKGGRPPTRKGRLGRNQYTRDSVFDGDAADSRSSYRDTSHDRHGVDSPRPNGNGISNNINGESGRSSKAKTHPARTSLNEMKRRVAAILEFVGHMQTETGRKGGSNSGSGSGSGSSSLKGNSTPNGASGGLPTANLVKSVVEGLQQADAQVAAAAAAAVSAGGEEKGQEGILNGVIPTLDLPQTREFEEMSANEMMETLTKELVAWQSLYGVYAR